MSTTADIKAEIKAWNDLPRRRVTSPSPRTPDILRHRNDADQIERALQEDDHRTWGFVIYRTCYGSSIDQDWPEFLDRLRLRMEENFGICNGRDVLDRFTLTVIEDPEHLDAVTTEAVRERFRQ